MEVIGCGGKNSDFAWCGSAACRLAAVFQDGICKGPDMNVVFFNSNFSYSVLHSATISQ